MPQPPLTPETFITITDAWNKTELAGILRSDTRTIGRWKGGERKIPGPVWAALDYHAALIDLSRAAHALLADPDAKETRRRLAAVLRRAERVLERKGEPVPSGRE